MLNNAVLKLRHCPEPADMGANKFNCEAEWMLSLKMDRETHAAIPAAISAASPAPAQPVVSFSAKFNSFDTGCSDTTAQEQVLPPTSHPPTHPPRPLTFSGPSDGDSSGKNSDVQ